MLSAARSDGFLINRSLSRRDWLCYSVAAATGVTLNSATVLKSLADEVVRSPNRKRSCILLWMSGGPSQIDTFDPKPGHANGGPVKAIDTAVPGIQISEYLPKVATRMKDLVPIRSMTSKEGDHGRAMQLVRTGSLPQGPIRYPAIGSLFSKELGSPDADLPNYVSVMPNRFLSPGSFSPGFLGPQYAPLFVGENGVGRPSRDGAEALRVRNIERPKTLTEERAQVRTSLLESLENSFQSEHPGVVAQSRRTAYEKALRLIDSTSSKAFRLDDEDATLRDAYGRNPFGQGCLLARRLVEHGVPFVEVSLNGNAGAGGIGWDTHANNFEAVQSLCETLDPAWSTLLTDLEQRGLLETTLVVWLGEFGRTPVINAQTGRDHFPVAWSAVLGGGGIRGGQVVGATTEDAMQVKDEPVAVVDLLATMTMALGIDPETRNMSNIGRPIPIADPAAKPMTRILS